jgi:hypothetical protein
MRAENMARMGVELLDIHEMQVALVGIRPAVDLPPQGQPIEFPASAQT